MALKRFWTEMSWADFQAADLSNAIAVVPLAAVEQHGPHLPVGTDLYAMDLYLRRVVERLPDDLAAVFLPAQPLGLSTEHIDFPGTLTLSLKTAETVWRELGEGIHRAGLRKLVFVCSNPAAAAALAGVSRDLRRRLGLFCVIAAWTRFGYPDGLFDPRELSHGAHGGDVETSLVMAARPDLVRDGAIESFSSADADIERDFTWLRTTDPAPFGWMAQDLHELGATGDPREATPQKGEAAADYGATAFIELLQDVEAFDLSRLSPGPLS